MVELVRHMRLQQIGTQKKYNFMNGKTVKQALRS